MSIESERRHRRFFSTKISPAPKPPLMFPSTSPKALFGVRSGLYEYPEPSGNEDDIILGYRNYSMSRVKQEKPAQNPILLQSSFRSGAPNRSVNKPEESFRNKSGKSVAFSICTGSPSQMRLAREHAASRNNSISGLSNISQEASARKSREQQNKNSYISGLF